MSIHLNDPREHVNVTGNVPTISEVAALAIRIGFRPRLREGTLEGTANIVFATTVKSRAMQIRDELVLMSWAFVHDKPSVERRWDTSHIITVLVTL